MATVTRKLIMHRFFSPLGARPWLTALVVFLGLCLTFGAWAASTPLGASPDEPSHIVKAASVVRGQFIGHPTDQPAITLVTVPGDLRNSGSWPCFMFQQNVPASCQPPFRSGPDGTMWTSAGLYNPVYYLLVGWPSLIANQAVATVMGMRVIAALLSAAFLAIGFAALSRLGLRFFAGLTTFALATPMVLFLGGTVNPNGLEVASGVALLSLLLAVVRGDGSGLRWMLPLTFLSAAVLVNMRGLSPLWMGLIGVTALVAARKGRLRELLRLPSVWLTLAGIAVAGVFAVIWILATNTLNAMGTYSGAGNTPPLAAFITMLVNRSVDPDFVGVFGWLDTFPPAFVYTVWGALAGGLVVLALVFAKRRLLAAFIVALASLALVPAVTQAASVMHSGYIWQGRYALVAFAAVVVVAGLIVGERFEGVVLRSAALPRALGVVSVLVLAGHVVAVAFAIKRYSRGADTEWLSFLLHPGWQPPGGAIVWILVMAVGVTVAAVAWRAAALADRRAGAAVTKDTEPMVEESESLESVPARQE